MTVQLPDGMYPFIDDRLPLSEMAMIEAPPDLEQLLRDQATKNGVELIRGQPVELRCQSAEYSDATFLVWLAEEDNRMHMLAQKAFATTRS